MPSYFAILGNTPELSVAELRAVVGSDVVEMVQSGVASLTTPDQLDLPALQNKLGGTVKLLRSEKILPSQTEEQALLDELAAVVKDLQISEFTLAEYGRDHLPKLEAADLKNQLKESGLSTRYHESPRSGASAALLLHKKKVTELGVVYTPEGLHLTTCHSVQNIDDWTVRDRQKPYADRKKGMLPPKVARMMVNVALGAVTSHHADPVRIYDPFCGSGTVLLEALMRDCAVVGSDLDVASVTGTEHNVAWLKEVYDKQLDSTVFLSDVTNVKLEQIKSLVDAIVTEPFLGKPTPRPDQVPNIIKGLHKLYWGAFRQWRSLLKPNGVVVMIFPLFSEVEKGDMHQPLIDKLAELGYTMMSEPVVYHRPQAIVQRQICMFRWQPA